LNYKLIILKIILDKINIMNIILANMVESEIENQIGSINEVKK